MASKKNFNSQAAAATAKLFSNKEPKDSSDMFSFRADKNNIKAWRLYAKITNVKIKDFCRLAIEEYITAHPLTAAEKSAFDEKMNS